MNIAHAMDEAVCLLINRRDDFWMAVADAQGMLNDISLEVTVAHRGVVSAQARVELSRPAVEQ